MSEALRDPGARPPLDVRTPSSWPWPSPGLGLSLFAGLALVATSLAHTIAPALPGSATGIATLIHVTSFIAACTSQLVAAGGIALCLRLVTSVAGWPGLGVAYRMTIVPTTLAVVLFTVTSAARPVAPELGRITAVAAIVAGLVTAPVLCSSVRTRSAGIVIFLAALGASFDLAAYEFARQLGLFQAARSSLGPTIAALALLLDASAALWALLWAAQGKGRIALFAVLLVVFILSGLAPAGERQDASGVLIVLYRSLETLASRPLLALPSSIAHSLSLLPIVAGATLLALRGRPAELRAALTLCLLGRTATGAPAAALLSVGAALLLLGTFSQGAPRERSPELPLKTH